ncbi:hypothetical protein [Rarobacter incanus]|uniref:hypothetical protein n=1 Tax=Rarobacter incanus TaxID=153494 RepID=UPI001150A9D7|nr:hypothetical protein [Rarobacter incanus]
MHQAVSVPGVPDAAPLWVTLGALFLIVLARSHATYWIARAASKGTDAAVHSTRSGRFARFRALIDAPSTARAMTLIHRFGPPAVTAAYITVGFQTAILVAAGLVRMPYGRFTLASLPGAAAWAAIWGTIGFAVFWGAVRAGMGQPAAIAAVGIGCAIVVVAVIVARRRRRD